MAKEIEAKLAVVRSHPGGADPSKRHMEIAGLLQHVIDRAHSRWHRSHDLIAFVLVFGEDVQCERMLSLVREMRIHKLNARVYIRDRDNGKERTEYFFFHYCRIGCGFHDGRCDEPFVNVVVLSAVNHIARGIQEVDDSFGVLYGYHFSEIAVITTTIVIGIRRNGIHLIHGLAQFTRKLLLDALLHHNVIGTNAHLSSIAGEFTPCYSQRCRRNVRVFRNKHWILPAKFQ
mmetsp:Transcript_14110/g.26855  ORF Transcript_14110/g.26855 Transcript_14110/m.26855 type:complete len:231 (-) Transcript_14110:238-930(-)